MYSTSSSRSHSPSSSRSPSPGPTPSGLPTLSEVAVLFRAADSDDRCAQAASAFARACGNFARGTLRELLSGLPAEAPLPVLCARLADALVTHMVCHSAVWNDLVHIIKFDPRLAGAQLALYEHCADCLAELHVPNATVWGELAALPLEWADELVLVGVQIAASMELAGVEEPVLWDTLIAAMAQVPDRSRADHGQMAQALEQAGVDGAAAWSALWWHFEAHGSGEGPQLIPLAQVFELQLSDSPDDQWRLASLLNRAARGCNADQLHDVVLMATGLTTLGEQRQAGLWATIGHAAFKLDADSLHEFFDALVAFDTPEPLPAVAWDELIKVACAQGVDALADLAVALKARGEQTRFERTVRLVLAQAGGGDGRALTSIASALGDSNFSLLPLRDLWLHLLMKADDVVTLDPSCGLRLFCAIGECPWCWVGEPVVLLDRLTQRVFESLQQGYSLDDLLAFAGALPVFQWLTPTFERILEVTGPTPHEDDIERVLRAMQEEFMPFTHPLMRWLPEAMSDETALDLLPFMLSSCELAASLEHEQAPLSLVVLTLEKAMRCDGQEALRALIASNTLKTEAVFRGPQTDADTLTALLVQLVTGGKELAAHPACSELGSWHLCNLALNTQAPQQKPHSRPYRAIIGNAIVHGALKLDQIEEIRSHRNLVRNALPGIHWDMVFNPGKHAPTTRVYAGFPALHLTVVECVSSLRDLAPGLVQWGQRLHQQKFKAGDTPRKEIIHLIRPLKRLLAHLNQQFAQSDLSNIVNSLWGPAGDGIPIDARLLTRLFNVTGDNATLHANVAALIAQLSAQLDVLVRLEGQMTGLAGEFETPYAPRVSPGDNPALADVAAAFRASWASLSTIADETFVANHRLGSEFVVSLISPDDVSNLILSHKVSGDGSPQGEHPEMMLERLAGGWVVWSIAKTGGDTAAVAWATLNEQQDLVIDCIDARVDLRESPLGNELVEALLAFGPKVAAAIGAKRVFVAPPKWARLESFGTFKRPAFLHDFVSGVPPFMGREPYTDSINRGAKYYIGIDPT